MLHALDLHLDMIHAVRNLFQAAHCRLQPLCPQAQFFQQCHHLATSAGQTVLCGFHFGRGGSRRNDQFEIGNALIAKNFQRPQVVRHATKNLILLETFRHRHFNRAIEWQFANADLL